MLIENNTFIIFTSFIDACHVAPLSLTVVGEGTPHRAETC